MNNLPKMTPFSAELLCNKCLQREHEDLHELANIVEDEGRKPELISAMLENRIEPRLIVKRHNQVTKEISDRLGIFLVTPIAKVRMSNLTDKEANHTIDDYSSLKEIFTCKDCLNKHLEKERERIKKKYGRDK